MGMISVVCVYNDQEILDKYLLASLDKQENNYQLILLDNRQRKYKSAAEALNHGFKQSTGSYVMFVHQDMKFTSQNWLYDVETTLENLPNLGVAGLAGRRHRLTISNLEHDTPPKAAGIYPLDHPQEVQTVDECLALVPRKLFQESQFDEETCTGWHLYVADYCLTLKSRGYQIYVLPHQAYHLSAGESFSEDYYEAVRKMRKKHEAHYQWMYTTAGNWHTRHPLSLQILYNKIYRLLVKIRGNI